MSNPTLDEEGRCLDRNGEFYEISSCYRLPTDKKLKRNQWHILLGDIDEFQNKPRRFFDTLLTLVEVQRANDPLINKGNRRQYWDSLVKGCEMWLSAVENGLYSEVERLAEPIGKKYE